jgi:hypothetical protein
MNGLIEVSIQRRLGNAEARGDFLRRKRAVGEEGSCRRRVFFRQAARPPAFLAFALCFGESGGCALADQGALEFGDCAQHVKDQHSARRRGVDCIREGDEAYAPSLQVFGGFDKLLERPRQPVEFPDNERIALAQHVAQEARQFQPIGFRAGGLLDDDALAPRLAQLFELEFWILIEGRYSGVADSHDLI